MTETKPSTFREALDEHLEAIRARDVERFAATLGDDVLVVDGKGAMTHGRDAVLASHTAWFRDRDAWTFDYDLVSTRELGDAGLALIEVTYRQTPEAAPARFLLSLLFARDAGGAWTFVYDQNTPLG
jgi:uncharacterized protein (TIGR02246 family)